MFIQVTSVRVYKPERQLRVIVVWQRAKSNWNSKLCCLLDVELRELDLEKN